MRIKQLRHIIREVIREMHEPGHDPYKDDAKIKTNLAPPTLQKPKIQKPKIQQSKIQQQPNIQHSKEGKMARLDSVEIAKDAGDVANMIKDCTNLPEWVEAKITLSADYMNTVKDYLSNHLQLQEKKIGFNRGPEYSEETIDLLKDFASAGEMLNQEIENKIIDNNDPKVQEILNILDNNLSVDSEFLTDIQTVLDLIQELPDKPKEKARIGYVKRDETN